MKPTAERSPSGKRRGPKPSISDQALHLVAIEAVAWERIPLGGRGTPQGLGS